LSSSSRGVTSVFADIIIGGASLLLLPVIQELA
jgi:hypothetical protein